MEVVFATSNRNKIKEAREILGFRIRSADLRLDEIQSISVVEIAKHKALQAHLKLARPVMVEDTGLFIEGLNGFPGPLAKWMVNCLGYERTCRAVDGCRNRKAYAETCVAFYDGKEMKAFTGRIRGTIAMHPRGNRKFGWDYIFMPEGGSGRTFAEMTAEEKNRISMRGAALKKLKRFLYRKAKEKA